MEKDFWSKSIVGVVGGGSWGTVLAQLMSANCAEVRLWLRDEELARSINGTRVNSRYFPELLLDRKICAYSSFERFFDGGEINLLVWVLPSMVCRENARRIAPFLHGHELILHATKGIEVGSMKRVSEILVEEMPIRRVGVISGPNLAHEIARQVPAGTVVSSLFPEVRSAGRILLERDFFRVYEERDLIGVEWAGALKNILAIASGALDARGCGTSARSLLLTRGLAEMVRFGVRLGATEQAFLSLAGVGDMLATCSSSLSRNYVVGYQLAHGEKLDAVLQRLGRVAEGVTTAESVGSFARLQGIDMPITQSVCRLLEGRITVDEMIRQMRE